MSSPIHPFLKGKRSAPGIYLYPPHAQEFSSNKDSVFLTCLVKNFYPADISVQWMKNHNDKVNEHNIGTFEPMKDASGDSSFFLYSKLTVTKASWNSGDSYTCMVVHEGLPMKFSQRSVQKSPGN